MCNYSRAVDTRMCVEDIDWRRPRQEVPQRQSDGLVTAQAYDTFALNVRHMNRSPLPRL